MFYGKIFKALNKAKVKYVVVGGVAVVLHGYHRLTQDLDLIVCLEEENLDKFFDVLNRTGYVPKVPVSKEQFKDCDQRTKWQKEKGMIVFSFNKKTPPFDLIDMFVNEPFPFDILYRNKINARIENIIVPLLNIDYLIKLKKKAGRPKDLDDIVQLKVIQKIKAGE